MSPVRSATMGHNMQRGVALPLRRTISYNDIFRVLILSSITYYFRGARGCRASTVLEFFEIFVRCLMVVNLVLSLILPSIDDDRMFKHSIAILAACRLELLSF